MYLRNRFATSSLLGSSPLTRMALASTTQRSYTMNTRLDSNSNNFYIYEDDEGLVAPRLRFLTGKDVDLDWTWDLDQVAAQIRRAHNNTV